MWQVGIRMLHYEHLYGLQLADLQEKSTQYVNVERILVHGEFMLSLPWERTLLNIPSTEKGPYQNLTQISPCMQFRLEHFSAFTIIARKISGLEFRKYLIGGNGFQTYILYKSILIK